MFRTSVDRASVVDIRALATNRAGNVSLNICLSF